MSREHDVEKIAEALSAAGRGSGVGRGRVGGVGGQRTPARIVGYIED